MNVASWRPRKWDAPPAYDNLTTSAINDTIARWNYLGVFNLGWKPSGKLFVQSRYMEPKLPGRYAQNAF